MISADTVTRTWQRMAATPPRQAHRLVEQMSREQPVLMTYLLATADQPLFNANEGQIIFYIGTVVWQMMRQSPRGLRRVTEAALERAEKANRDALAVLAEDTVPDMIAATEAMLRTYPEPEVLRYIAEAIMEDDDDDPDDPPIRDECRGIAFFELKTVLDALITACR